MANGLNKVMLIGNLGADPELRHTQGGTAVLNARMATTQVFLTDGERQEKTEWHSVVLWGKRAEGLAKVLVKGSRLYVEGRLTTRKWQDKDGNDRYSTEVTGTDVILLGGKRKEGSGAEDADVPEHGDDDIPF